MKRTLLAIPSLVLLMSLTLVSCDAMFNENVFAKLTHPTPSAADLAQKTPDQMLQYISSQQNMSVLTANADLKTAAIDSLKQTYTTSTVPVELQTAAVAAAEISIQTVPAASQLSASIIGALLDNTSLSVATTSDITTLVTKVLPSDIATSLANGDTTPPASFTAMIEAYTQANAAYAALAASITSGGTGTYDPSINLGSNPAGTSAAKSDIAVNAVISTLIGSITPTTSASTADVLWAAMSGGSTDFTVTGLSASDLTSSSSTNPAAILVNASGLDLSKLIGGGA